MDKRTGVFSRFRSSSKGRSKRAILKCRTFFPVLCSLIVLLRVVSLSSQRHGSNTIKFTLGTVIRGDEWTGDMTPSKFAVLNSIKSFIRAVGSKRVVLFVDSQTSCASRPAFTRKCTCQSLSACVDPVYGVPTMDCIFDLLFDLSKTDVVGFFNGDILVFDSLPRAVTLVAREFPEFLVVGRRHRGDKLIHFDEDNLWHYAELHAKTLPLDHGYAIDYFVTRKDVYDKSLRGSLPPFVIGAWRWDNVLLSSFFKHTNVTVADVTYAAPVMHQLPGAGGDHVSRRGAEFNDELAKHYSGTDFLFGSVDFADVQIRTLSAEEEYILDPYHSLVRKVFQSGALSTADIAALKTYYEKRNEQDHHQRLSLEDHLASLRDFRQQLAG